MDRQTRREIGRATAKYVDKCAVCNQVYKLITLTGQRNGKWVVVCGECGIRTGGIDYVQAVGLYMPTGLPVEQQAKHDAALRKIAPLMKNILAAKGGTARMVDAERQALAAAFKAEAGSSGAEIHMVPDARDAMH
jgi:predicted amidophosphoribosyltransferase